MFADRGVTSAKRDISFEADRVREVAPTLQAHSTPARRYESVAIA